MVGAIEELLARLSAGSLASQFPVALSVLGLGLLLLVARPVWTGLTQTSEFISSLSHSKKQGRIGAYNEQYAAEKTADDRNSDYANIVDSYYDVATEFYEWGWGTSFHFADKRAGESFRQSILRHEYYLAGRLGLKHNAKVLDCGCGVGGPARNIARFTGANIKAVTLNQYQVNRGNMLSAREGLRDQVELVQADFMELPFEEKSFDGVYAIESTCHAPDRSKVYGEIMRVLKPGAVFACYEWCLTDKYDANNPEHVQAKKDIEYGDGLPDLVHTSVCTQALKDAGFEVLEARDVTVNGALAGGEAWYVPLTASWNPLKWPRFQFNPIMFALMPYLLWLLEWLGAAPEGTVKTQQMLQRGGLGLAKGGVEGIFTPAWLMVGRKPL